MSKRILTLGLSTVSLMLLLACGGGGSTPPPPPATATSITYTNPTSVPGTSYELRKNTTLSTPGSHLVLDLYGPATSVTGSGVVLTLNLDGAKATWGNVSTGNLVTNGNLFVAPIVKAKVTGDSLQVVVTEKGTGTAKPLAGPLLQIAVDLKTGLTLGTPIAITPDLTKSQVILQGSANPSNLVDLRIGTLTAQ
ncbi:MAG: hypothetical protein Q8O00_12580 [Holophaga sp.]|nr:hypothetical protein [Holophaga sp.]